MGMRAAAKNSVLARFSLHSPTIYHLDKQTNRYYNVDIRLPISRRRVMRMSVSTTQLEANRANSERSTGPRTAEGKDASSRNATRHGFLARVLPAEQQDYRALL